MDKYLLRNSFRYPLMRAEDYVKQIYQAEYGCEHILGANCESILKDECLSFADNKQTSLLFDEISDELVRINLKPYLERGFSLSTLTEIMKKVVSHGTTQGLNARLDDFSEAVDAGKIDLPAYSARRFVSLYRQNGYGPVRHSASYRLNYFPHYRVAYKKHAVLLPLIARIEHLLYRRLNVTVAIDGNCGAGKTFYANVLSEYFNNCPVLHADDFYLPEEMRTQERFSENIGSIHYERLAETLEEAKKGGGFTYDAYDCHTGNYTRKTAAANRLLIVEGSYCLNPYLARFYDLGALFTVNDSEQRMRIMKREGRDGWEKFKNVWIPAENAYLAQLDTSKYVSIDTNDIEYD